MLYNIYLKYSTFPRRTERDMIKYVCWSSCKVPLFLSESNETWIFSTNLRKKKRDIKFSGNPSSWSRVPCGQMDMTKSIVAFRSFAEKPKNGISVWSRNMLHCLCHEEKGNNNNNNNNNMMMMRTRRLGHLQNVLLVCMLDVGVVVANYCHVTVTCGVFLARSQQIHVMKVTLLYRELPKLVYTIVFCSWETASFPFSL
jgi:hypothetical protein